MKKHLIAPVVLAALHAFCITGQAAVVEVDQINVTGSRITRSIDEVPAPTYVITQEDIQQSGAADVQSLLGTIPGVNGLPGGASATFDKGVIVRGLGTQVLLMVDGVPYLNTSHGSGTEAFTYDLRSIPINQVERIEVVKGATSAIYGSQAAAGVINIITKKATGSKPTVTTKLEGGTDGWINGGISAYIPSSALNTRVYYGRTQEDDRKIRLLPDGTYDNSIKFRGNDYSIGFDKGPWDFSFQAGDYKSSWQNTFYGAQSVNTQKNKYDRFSLGYDNGSNNFKLYTYRNRRDYSYEGAEAPTVYDGRTWGATYYNSSTWDKRPFVFGLDWRHEASEVTGDYAYDTSRWGVAPFAETSFAIGQINLDLSLRYEYWDVKHGEDVNEFIPRLSFNWENSNGQLWYATAGRFFAMPSLYEINAADSWGSTLPNPDLKPEYGWTYDLGIKDQKAKNPWSFGLFYLDLNDKIDYKYDAETWVGQYINLYGFRSWGAEGQVTFPIGNHFSYTQGLTWTKAEEQLAPNSSWTRSGLPRWDIAGHLDYKNGPWSSRLSAHLYMDRQLTTTDYSDGSIFLMNWSIGWKQKDTTIRLTAHNLFDREFVIGNSGYLAPERKISLSWEQVF